VISDNQPVSFIAEGAKSYLVDISEDKHPQFEVTFDGKYEHRDPENVDAEEYIAKKGIAAKGKKCHQYDVKSVRFIEPLHKPEDDIPEEPEEGPEYPEGEGVDIEQTPDPVDILTPMEGEGAKLPDIDDIPDIGDIEEPTLF
jgi:hypothetical protein